MDKRKDPYFSVVIPTLNEEKYLPKLLQDLVGQSYKDFEVIVVDSSSDDKTIIQAKKFKRSLRNPRIFLSKKRNVGYQRNFGADKAVGKWIIFMDADNSLPNYFLEGVKYKISKNSPDFFTCWMKVDSDKAADKAIATFTNVAIEAGLASGYPAAIGALIGIKRDRWRVVGGFDEDAGFAEDRDFVRKSFERGLKIKIFREPKFTYSLRRVRRLGLITHLRKYSELNLKRLSGEKIKQEYEYPMGGGVGNRDETILGQSETLERILKKSTKKPKFLKKIQSLITIVEEPNGN